MSGAGKVVCVTGASGYIASWLVKLLLQRGYTVKASVRDPNDSKKTEHLLSLAGAKERLHLFKANLLEEGSFDSLVDGCEGVFHTASPVSVSPSDPQVELIDPAVKGTLNVLRSCIKVPSVKRVVVTSSMASVASTGALTPNVIVDETWLVDPVVCEESKNWYALSKILSEDAAWKFARENKIDLVTLHPGLTIGPLLQPTLNLTVDMVLNHVNGTQTFPNMVYRFVDVRDVALAHILALEVPSASGRICLVGSLTNNVGASKILRQLYPALNLHEIIEDDQPQLPMYQVSKEKAKGLGVDFIPLEVSLRDTVESLKDKSFLNI
ncbi:hypothetical protein FNV43_RR20090 [Rhamnella rubrinervis]|uniref:NAD-dependent epimerase/dehydratase domain-containing protein n=1 Tax=Rhamnella rubrinervis TaxID=2594499 RepID=A0A8K0GQ49_9ROSA|nr:hypothetical protein FNV43_RR20090 [Rhamnella rubrinervis]